MSHFKMVIYGESPLSHDELGDKFDHIAEVIEQEIDGEVSLSYSPTDEYGDIPDKD